MRKHVFDMTDENEFQAFATREAARAIGQWLEGRNIHAPIRTLTLADLEAMAAAAISRWVAVRAEQAERERTAPEEPAPVLM